MRVPLRLTTSGNDGDPTLEVRVENLPLTFELAAGGVWVSKHAATVQFLTPCCQTQWHYVLADHTCATCKKQYILPSRSLEYKWDSTNDVWLPAYMEALGGFLEYMGNSLENIVWQNDLETVLTEIVTWLRHRHYLGMDRRYEETFQEAVNVQRDKNLWTTWA